MSKARPFSDLNIDYNDRSLTLGRKGSASFREVKFFPVEFNILLELLRYQGELCSPDELNAYIPRPKEKVQKGKPLPVLRRHISRIRQKLDQLFEGEELALYMHAHYGGQFSLDAVHTQDPKNCQRFKLDQEIVLLKSAPHAVLRYLCDYFQEACAAEDLNDAGICSTKAYPTHIVTIGQAFEVANIERVDLYKVTNQGYLLDFSNNRLKRFNYDPNPNIIYLQKFVEAQPGLSREP